MHAKLNMKPPKGHGMQGEKAAASKGKKMCAGMKKHGYKTN
jgi:hypothetical protein